MTHSLSKLSFQAKGDSNAATGQDEMAIFQSAGECINPYLDVTTGTTVRDTGREFTFKAFTFDSNTQDDTIEIVSIVDFVVI